MRSARAGLYRPQHGLPRASGQDPGQRPPLGPRRPDAAARGPPEQGAGTRARAQHPLISPCRGRSATADPPNTECMAAADVQVIATDTEMERVELWRAEELVRAGFDASDAVALAARHDIDLHLAIDLVRRGCPYETAIDILI